MEEESSSDHASDLTFGTDQVFCGNPGGLRWNNNLPSQTTRVSYKSNLLFGAFSKDGFFEQFSRCNAFSVTKYILAVQALRRRKAGGGQAPGSVSASPGDRSGDAAPSIPVPVASGSGDGEEEHRDLLQELAAFKVTATTTLSVKWPSGMLCWWFKIK